MKVKWLGHASFLITADDGTKIVTDPYEAFGGLSYKPIEETADIVVASHKHGDHFGAKIKGNPRVVTEAVREEIKGIEIKGVATFHDTSKGSERGSNTVFCLTVDGLRLCHLGDLGHQLSESEIAEIGHVDVLLVPVGGFYTIDNVVASKISDQMRPKVVIPMHFKNDKCAFPIHEVDEFLKGKTGVKRLDSSEVELKLEQLPEATEIIVLEHAL